MKNKLLITIILVLSLINLLQGQNYNGPYNSKNFVGNAYYTYSEGDLGRIYEGEFRFSSNNNSISITGNYKKNRKNGEWNHHLKNVNVSDGVMNYVINATSKGSFLEGNLSGQWILNRNSIISFSSSGFSDLYLTSLNTISYFFDGKTVDSKKSTSVLETCIANFNNNHFSGNFSYSINKGKSKVIGQFSDEGYFDGTWTILFYQNGILYNQFREYNKGVLITVKHSCPKRLYYFI